MDYNDKVLLHMSKEELPLSEVASSLLRSVCDYVSIRKYAGTNVIAIHCKRRYKGVMIEFTRCIDLLYMKSARTDGVFLNLTSDIISEILNGMRDVDKKEDGKLLDGKTSLDISI